MQRLTSFAKAVGLKQNEIKITMIDSNRPLETVATAMLDHGTGMSQMLRVRPALH